MKRSYAGRSGRLTVTSEGEQGFWPSYADMMSAVALILFFLMLLSYIQNLITGNDLRNTQEVLEETRQTLALTTSQVEEAQKELISVSSDLEEAKITLNSQQEEIQGYTAAISQYIKDIDTYAKEIAGQEETIHEQQQLIDKAECFKTQAGKVSVHITERVPVVRVMARNGDDYYVDKDGLTLQNTGYSCNLMVATGHIDRAFASRVLAPIGRLIVGDDFWRNQVEQLNVLADSTIELVPRVGGHIVSLGRPVGVAKKLERLRKFYKYGLSQAGWNKYSRISVEYDNQIVCKKK